MKRKGGGKKKNAKNVILKWTLQSCRRTVNGLWWDRQVKLVPQHFVLSVCTQRQVEAYTPQSC